MANKLFLYIDILGFGDLIESGADVAAIYRTIDELNVHRDDYFTCIVFSDTVVVYAADEWLEVPNQGLMWLIEFAQDLFYRLIAKNIHFRAFITLGEFEHYKLKNFEAYYGKALVECYRREKTIQCVGVFIDERLAHLSDIFHTTKFSEGSHFVHVMQHLDEVSTSYNQYPISGEALIATGMEWWTAYLLRYLENIYRFAKDEQLPPTVRRKYRNAWEMIGKRHGGLLQRLQEADFKFSKVIRLDWSEPLARIGTEAGAWG